MKRLTLIFTIFSVLTIFSSNAFAQSSDDSDGDGIKNSEDACPFEKGSLANKGCPSEDEPTPLTTPAPMQNKTAEQLTPEFQADLQRLNQLLKTLEGGKYSVAEIIDGTIYFRLKESGSRSLKLNDLLKVTLVEGYSDLTKVVLQCKDGKNCVNYSDATGTSKSFDDYTFYATGVSEITELFTTLNNLVIHSQPNTSNAAKKTGLLSDCKFILSEGCRNFLLNSTIDELRSPLKLEPRSENVFGSYDRFEVTVEPSSGGIIEKSKSTKKAVGSRITT